VGMEEPYEDETQCSQAGPKLNETVPCNNFPCNSVRPQNKLYWQALYENTLYTEGEDMDTDQVWPFSPSSTFPCTRGDKFQFSLKKWSDILEDAPYPENTPWHFLAKEYIANRLNRAEGTPTEGGADQALEEAQYLLSKCDGYTPEETLRAYSTKEKLSRANNGIGGLSDVDLYLGIKAGGGGMGGDLGDSQKFLPSVDIIIAMVVVVAVVVVLMVVAVVVVRRRWRQPEVIVDRETYDPEEEEQDERSAEALHL